MTSVFECMVENLKNVEFVVKADETISSSKQVTPLFYEKYNEYQRKVRTDIYKEG